MMAPLRLRAFSPLCGSRPFFFSSAASLLVAVETCLSQHVQVPRYGEITQTQCSRPCGTLTCYLHTAIWLGRSQSLLTQIQQSSERDMVCHRVSPFTPTTCWPAGPSPLNGRWLNQEISFGPSIHCRKKMQTVIVLKTFVMVLYINVGDAMLSNLLRCSGTCRPRTDVLIFRPEDSGVFLGIREEPSALLLPHNPPGSRSIFTSHDRPRITTLSVSKKHMGRMNVCKLFRFFSFNSVNLVHSRWTM